MKNSTLILLIPLLLSGTACVDDIVRQDDGNGPGETNGDITEVRQDFNDYRGTKQTLPAGFFVSWDEDRAEDPFMGVGNFDTSDPARSYGGFTAYTSGNGDYSFGIRERIPVDLQDSRLFVPITNNTDQFLFEFNVSYDVEAWFIGDRRNRIRLKYDDDPEASGSFDEDIFSTDNPSSDTTPGTKVNGSLPQHRVTVSGIVDVASLERNGVPIGPLAPGATGYFRWQFSNADGDDGETRSGLAINNVVIEPLIDE